jgi:hypothetical protein
MKLRARRIVEVSGITLEIVGIAEGDCVLAEAIKIPGVSRSLSLITAGSSTNALFGGESGEAVAVTQSGAGPEAFVAAQPEGSAGATTLSNFSTKLVQSGPEAGAAPVEISMRRVHAYRRRECAACY